MDYPKGGNPGCMMLPRIINFVNDLIGIEISVDCLRQITRVLSFML